MGNSYDKETQKQPKQSVKEDPLTPIIPKFRSEVHQFNLQRKHFTSLHKKKNYGFLPSNCIHKIVLHLDPPDLYSVMLSCRVVHTICSTSLFWKQYFKVHFGKDLDGLDGIFDEDIFTKKEEIEVIDNDSSSSDEDEEEEKLNYKEMFYQRYVLKKDSHYRTKYTKNVVGHYPSKNHNMATYGIISSGAFEFNKHLLEEFMENPNPDDSSYRFNVTDDKSNHYITLYDPSKNVVKQDILDGVFLCFSVYDRESFNEAKNMHKQVLKSNCHKNCMFLMIGIVSQNERMKKERRKKKLIVGDNVFNVHTMIERDVQYVEAVKFSIRNKFVGYVECDLNHQNRNVYHSFGVMLDSVKQRKASVEKRKK